MWGLVGPSSSLNPRGVLFLGGGTREPLISRPVLGSRLGTGVCVGFGRS